MPNADLIDQSASLCTCQHVLTVSTEGKQLTLGRVHLPVASSSRQHKRTTRSRVDRMIHDPIASTEAPLHELKHKS